MKIIVVNTPKGQYSVPLKIVVENRSDYYCSERNEDWKEEYDWVMRDDYEGVDWLINNMNWEDVEKFSTKLNDKVLVTDQDFWTSTEDFEIRNE